MPRLRPYLIASRILALVLIDLSVFVGGVDDGKGVIVHVVLHTTAGVGVVARWVVPTPRPAYRRVSGRGHHVGNDAGILIVSWLVVFGRVNLILIGRR